MALDNKSPEYKTFIKAVKNGRTAEIEQQLTEHPEFLDLSNDQGYMPLHWAAQNGHDSTVYLLLQHGSTSFDFPDNDGWTPLHEAAWYGRDSTITILKAATEGGVTGPEWAGAITLHFDQLNQQQIAKLQAPIPEEEILEIRYRIYFSRPLLSTLL